MVTQPGMQEARLVALNGITIITTVEVPAFPNAPTLLIINMSFGDVPPTPQYFVGGHLDYNGDFLIYNHVEPYAIKS